MTYTLWHAGVMIGETDFAHKNPVPNPRQRAGIFHPTSYGERLLPRLSGILSACSGLKDDIEARGLDPDAMDTDGIVDVLETTDAGRKVIDVGRALSEVEIRDRTGRQLQFKQIAFMDMEELRTLSRRLSSGHALPDVLPPDAPRFIVSATLRSAKDWSPRQTAPA